MISISERLRARQEPVGDGSGKWRKDGLCQEAAEIMDALVAALEEARTAMNDWTVAHAGDMCGDEAVAETYTRIQASCGTLGYICDVNEKINAALAKAKGKQE